jgi:hypothetical protein
MWPSRVVRIRLAPGDDSIAAVEVLESGHPAMGAPAGACVTPDGAILFLANPGWSNLGAGGEPGGRSRPVAIMRTRIPAAPARPVR